jgi:hypothetical protein
VRLNINRVDWVWLTEAGGGAIGGVLSRFIALDTDLSNAQGGALRA